VGGWLNSIAPVIIVPYYCVIGGWVTKYCVAMLVNPISNFHKDCMVEVGGKMQDAATAYFNGFITSTWEPILYFLLFAAILIAVVAMGVEKGIERFNKVLMPLLVLMCFGICIYCCFLPNAQEGFQYYFYPDASKFTYMTVVAAMGQLFFSLSIAMGIMVTYGSYMRKDDPLESSVRNIEVFDTAVAFLAGLIIVPAVFIFSNGDAEALNKGPSLMFVTMPQVFRTMPAGQVIGALFFILVTLAALTSSISLMEVVTAVVIEKFRVKRMWASVIVIVITLLLGLLSVFGYSIWSDVTLMKMQILDFFDFITNNIMMPILAFLTCIMIGYVVKTKYVEDEVLFGEDRFRSVKMYRIMIKFICPVCMILILLTPFITDI
jgi:NSS family neurotransmitter:Na+ symporter